MNFDNITIKLLKTFKTVSVQRNHTKAADKLNITQPAVTKQIKQLEDVLGLQLFFYKNRQLHLTDAATSLLPKTEEVLLELENLSHTIQEYIKGPAQGTITLGVVHAAQDKVFDMLEIFHNSYHKIKVNIIFSDHDGIIEKLKSQEIDFAFMGDLEDDLPIDVLKYETYKLQMIAPKNYDDLSSKNIDMSRLADKKKILNEKGSFSRTTMENLFNKEQLSNTFEINNNYTVVNAVANGFGIALVPDFIINDKAKRKIQILKIKDLSISGSLNLVNLKERRLSKIDQVFKSHINKHSTAS